MAKYYFVKVPRGIRVSEARKLISEQCDCQVKNAAPFCFFVKVNSGSIDGITKNKYDNDETFIIEESNKANDDNWDTLRQPRIIRTRRQQAGRNAGRQTRP